MFTIKSAEENLIVLHDEENTEKDSVVRIPKSLVSAGFYEVSPKYKVSSIAAALVTKFWNNEIECTDYEIGFAPVEDEIEFSFSLVNGSVVQRIRVDECNIEQEFRITDDPMLEALVRYILKHNNPT